ncbi:MAG: GGDEF domain-containing protein [Lachnospiraceae bacterium]|nr:GGDEF domain-containing protein [Lachnospiraceae bacterium]
MKMSETLFDNIINTSQDCVFWKDRERRFVGVNQAFLDFYGFDSADVLIGKTDEDMGWHSDPEPYKQDELRVLEGHSTYKVPGKCVIRGEERDIVASKRPIYEGDEIVGLVGSFIDITDVLRKGAAADRTHAVYTVDKLRKYPYFDRILNETPIEEILDHLTGLISRGFFLNFVKDLIRTETPFSYAIIDLDNFKFINDTYGHHAGDLVLSTVSGKLMSYTDGFALAGRFGGDELVLVNLRDTGHQEITGFFEELYTKENILRMNLNVDESELFITATSGCALFPADASDYPSLFAKIDKTLYVGKSRGRNCYTIYSEKDHADLEMKKLAKQGLYSNLNRIISEMEQTNGFENRILAMMNLLRARYDSMELLYVGKTYVLHSPLEKSLVKDVSDIADLLGEDELWAERDFGTIREKSPKLFTALDALNVRSAMIVKIGLNYETDGYLICADHRSGRLWQEEECGIFYFAAKSLAAYLRLGNEEIPG